MRLCVWKEGKAERRRRLTVGVAQLGPLGLAVLLAACSGSSNVKISEGSESGTAGAGGTGGTGTGSGGGGDVTAGSGGDDVEAGSAIVDDGGSLDETPAVEEQTRSQPEPHDDAMSTPPLPPIDASDAAVDLGTGPRTLFSFDSDASVTSCDPSFVVPPCWLIIGADDGGGVSGSFDPIGDDALAGHVPARALRWTATYPGFGGRTRLLGTFAANQNWTQRTRLHFPVKVVSGFSSIRSYDLYVQGGVPPNYPSIYEFNLPDNLIPEAGSGFVDLTIDLTRANIDPLALQAAAGLGIALTAISEPLAGESAPAPTVIELDNIWLE